MVARRTSPSESDIQASFIIWINLQYPIIADVTASFANGGHRDPRYGHRLKREGLKRGFPDVGIFTARGKYHGMFIEFKSAKGKLTTYQRQVMVDLRLQGYRCVVCKSLDEAMNETVFYVEGLHQTSHSTAETSP